MRDFVRGIIALVRLLMVFAGIIMMMCECVDFATETKVNVLGLALLVLALLPEAISSWIEERRENDGYIR